VAVFGKARHLRTKKARIRKFFFFEFPDTRFFCAVGTRRLYAFKKAHPRGYNRQKVKNGEKQAIVDSTRKSQTSA
jgi:hypothetical protein